MTILTEARRVNPSQGFPNDLIWVAEDEHGFTYRFVATVDHRWSVCIYSSANPFGTILVQGTWAHLPGEASVAAAMREAAQSCR